MSLRLLKTKIETFHHSAEIMTEKVSMWWRVGILYQASSPWTVWDSVLHLNTIAACISHCFLSLSLSGVKVSWYGPVLLPLKDSAPVPSTGKREEQLSAMKPSSRTSYGCKNSQAHKDQIRYQQSV
ncbi:hypothetical protein AMECASPLE_032185 [Ameca splendens]|uniref:Uncharacterized protein n=1 Tax=Ameca splendens TaxID=208324 RepID=A0ABV0YIJ4_9TELE